MIESAERRKHLRVATNRSLEYVVGRHRGSGRLADISLGGIGLIASHRMLRKGMQPRIRFRLDSETIETDVVICRVEGEERLGAFFVNLNPAQRAALEKLTTPP